MPAYDYRCKSCDFQFEAIQSISASPLNTCPKCAGSIQRLISKNVGIAFKGSGFYINDCRKTKETVQNSNH